MQSGKPEFKQTSSLDFRAEPNMKLMNKKTKKANKSECQTNSLEFREGNPHSVYRLYLEHWNSKWRQYDFESLTLWAMKGVTLTAVMISANVDSGSIWTTL